MSSEDLSRTNASHAASHDAPRLLSEKDTLEHAWRYFALHAGQRMSMFHYFLVLFGLVSAGLAGALRAEGPFKFFGVPLGVGLCFVAHVFQKLDGRSSFLIKHAEDALREAEAVFVAPAARLFLREPTETADAEQVNGVWTYGKSFRRVFRTAWWFGAIGAIVALTLGAVTQ